ncbi:pimeloyl-ACP methyl ester carboxylesterase [Inhella inkyongensis]|uniref:Pimeloyl-ACP methyl ester carboxylesterase n=1 Tax=Inhella inkyongensis TaxID=392593 RepID=A0A840S8Z4_9BURK|nr:alpha/beta fold hydrolase [Inhella inkyongensis]MBB5205466.1 pimeloyl-ACP methyl ester carboxylesterase [Inhella inkyongensis]
MELIVLNRRVYAYTGGKPFDAALPCVVFLHGALHDHSVFTLLARSFAHSGFSVLALDLPAHGRSEGPPPESIEAAGAWVLACLDAAGVQQAAFVGHSMGSLIALEAAAQAPDRAWHLALLGTAAPMGVSPALLGTAASDPVAAMRMVNTFSHSGIAAKPGYPGPGAWLHGANQALMERTQAGWLDGNLFLKDFELCNGYANALQAAAKVRCTSTVVIGALDQMTPARSAKALMEALKARTVALNCGHAMMQEDPEGLRACLGGALVQG